MSLALTRNKQIGLKVEATPGTKETLTAADYGLYCSEITPTVDPELIKLEAYRGTISAAPQRIGKVPAKVTLKGELKGSNVANTSPHVAPVLMAAGMRQKAVRALTLSASTLYGNLVLGKSVITGATSGAQGLVLYASATEVKVALLTAAFSTENVTCDEVGFSGTVSALGALEGFAFVPGSDPAVMGTVTAEVRDSGSLALLYGGVSTFSLELSTDSYPTWSAEITGIADKAAWGTACTEMAGVDYADHMPAVVTEAALSLDGVVSPVTASVAVDLGNNVALLKDLNSPTWYRRGVVTSRDATASLEILALSPAEYPVYSKLFTGATAHLSFKIGSGAGTEIAVFCPAAQFVGVSQGDTDGFAANSIKLGLTGDDSECILWFK